MIKLNYSYTIDGIGNLIRLEQGSFPNALIPHSVTVVTYAHELAFPFPWTMTEEKALNEILSLPAGLVLDSICLEVYELQAIPRTPLFYVPPSPSFAEEDEVFALIEIYEGLSLDDQNRIVIETELSTVGIFRMPVPSYCNPATHVTEGILPITGHSRDGWLSHTKIYRKASPILTTGKQTIASGA